MEGAVGCGYPQQEREAGTGWVLVPHMQYIPSGDRAGSIFR